MVHVRCNNETRLHHGTKIFLLPFSVEYLLSLFIFKSTEKMFIMFRSVFNYVILLVNIWIKKHLFFIGKVIILSNIFSFIIWDAGLTWEGLEMKFTSCLHPSQYHIYFLFSGSSDFKWPSVITKFFISFVLFTIVFFSSCKMLVVYSMVEYIWPFFVHHMIYKLYAPFKGYIFWNVLSILFFSDTPSKSLSVAIQVIKIFYIADRLRSELSLFTIKTINYFIYSRKVCFRDKTAS